MTGAGDCAAHRCCRDLKGIVANLRSDHTAMDLSPSGVCVSISRTLPT
jgi:hypothetical protein